MKAFHSLTAGPFLSLLLLTMPILSLSFAARAEELNTTSTLEDTAPESSIDTPAAPTAQAPVFDPAIEDLPLMPGLTAATEEDTVFIVPRSGRIADSVAVGTVDVDDVYWFYRRTLPQLGWKIEDARTFQRDQERLRINAHADGKVTTVRFSLLPR